MQQETGVIAYHRVEFLIHVVPVPLLCGEGYIIGLLGLVGGLVCGFV